MAKKRTKKDGTTETVVEVNVKVPLQKLRDLLVNAFEGGSNYWYEIDEPKAEFARGLCFDDFREGGKAQPPGEYYHWSQLIPTTEGCSLFINSPDMEMYGMRLNIPALEKGIRVMANKYPAHFANVTGENDDAETGDVFLQCCLFGEIIFG